MATETNALDLCRECIDAHRSFVLQGGAGSGKTESLKELLLYIKQSQPQARVACVTHTNAAVAEIVSRVGDRYPISTIHSFLYELIGHYKKNIKSVMPELFFVSPIVRNEMQEGTPEAEYKKAEHDKYKKIYSQYAKKLFSILKESCPKVVGKREYDKNPEAYNCSLNDGIEKLNQAIKCIIEELDYSKVYYNQTKFDSMRDLGYGHDGLIALFHLLFEQFPLLGKIVADKYDYIFIDEYQDTNASVLSDFLNLSTQCRLTIGLFGDCMQAIYDKGIDTIDNYVNDGVLVSIPKADNYRCSYEVIDFINPLRFDGIRQDVAFKKLMDGSIETEADRHGTVKVLYAVVDKKPTAFSTTEEKEVLHSLVNSLIAIAQKDMDAAKILVLTNKAIAEKNGFKELYRVFDDRYADVSERIEDYLRSIQALDVSDLCQLFLNCKYNELISMVKKAGYTIHNRADKQKLHNILQGIIDNKQVSLFQAIEIAVQNKLIKQSETASNIFERNVNWLQQLSKDTRYQDFKKLYQSGQNTYTKIQGFIELSSEEDFNDLVSQWKRERFVVELGTQKIKFADVLAYTKYLEEETEYITMHKTKGTSITSVIVVMEEYFWNEYDFSLLYRPNAAKPKQTTNSRKLIYVACSRARKDLTCIRVITEDEREQFLRVFPQAEEVSLLNS